MLIPLLMNQPQMLGPIVRQTPYWVWGLLAALVWLGASQMFHRKAHLGRVVVMPLAMAGFSLYGLASAFGAAGHTAGMLAAWAATAAGAAISALWFQPTPPPGTRYDSASRMFSMPGSTMPLALILGIFITKYLVGVELALQPSLARSPGFALQIATLYGLFNGFFAARALRLWRLVQRGHQLDTAVGV